MLEKFFLWILDWLRVHLDTDLKKRLDDYKAERARVQAQTVSAQQALARDTEMLRLLSAQRSAVRDQISAAESELERLKKELGKIDGESTTSGPGDVDDSFHTDLTPHQPGANRER